MSGLEQSDNPVAKWVGGVAAGLMPSSIKAINRLLGAMLNYPIALIDSATASVEAKTAARKSVDAAIVAVAAQSAAGNNAIIAGAVENLVRKEYRNAENKAAIVTEALEHAKSNSSSDAQSESVIDDDWLNVFERYAEDASSERLRSLWARVLSGEIYENFEISFRNITN
jgi:hypothetical protein